MTCFSLLLVYHRLLLELQSEGTLTPEQSLRVKEWLNSVEEEPSRLTTASGPDSGIENSSTEDAVALRRGRPSLRNQVCVLSLSQVCVQLGEVCSTDMSTRGFFLTRIQRQQRRGGAVSMTLTKVERTKMVWLSFKLRFSD